MQGDCRDQERFRHHEQARFSPYATGSTRNISYSSDLIDMRAVSTLSLGIIRASFEHWSAVISLHIVPNSPMTARKLPERATERRRETI